MCHIQLKAFKKLVPPSLCFPPSSYLQRIIISPRGWRRHRWEKPGYQNNCTKEHSRYYTPAKNNFPRLFFVPWFILGSIYYYSLPWLIKTADRKPGFTFKIFLVWWVRSSHYKTNEKFFSQLKFSLSLAPSHVHIASLLSWIFFQYSLCCAAPRHACYLSASWTKFFLTQPKQHAIFPKGKWNQK